MPSPRPAQRAVGHGAHGRREVLVVLLVGVAVLATALGGPLAARWHDPPSWLDLDVAPPTAQVAGPTAPAEPVVERPAGPAPPWLSRVVTGLAVVALVAAVVVLLRWAVRALLARWRAIDRGGAGGESGGVEALDGLDDVAQAALRQGVTRAGLALREDLPPGDAVVAAWLALERAAQECGLSRDPARTATEFTLSLLGRTSADPAAARRLLGLYHAARFSDHPVGAAEVASARAALDTLAVALTGPAGERTAP